MEPIVTWLLMVQLWTDPPPKIQIVYKKEYATREECMKAREEWLQKKFETMCMVKVTDVNAVGK